MRSVVNRREQWFSEATLELLNYNVSYFFAGHILWFSWVFFQWEGKTFLLSLQKLPFLKNKTVKQIKSDSFFSENHRYKGFKLYVWNPHLSFCSLLWTKGLCIFIFQALSLCLISKNKVKTSSSPSNPRAHRKTTKTAGFHFHLTSNNQSFWLELRSLLISRNVFFNQLINDTKGSEWFEKC